MAVDYVLAAALVFGCKKSELLSYKEHADKVVVILPSGQKKTCLKESLDLYITELPAEGAQAELPAVKPAAEPSQEAKAEPKPKARSRKAAK